MDGYGKVDIQNVQWWRVSRTGLRSIALLKLCNFKKSFARVHYIFPLTVSSKIAIAMVYGFKDKWEQDHSYLGWLIVNIFPYLRDNNCICPYTKSYFKELKEYLPNLWTKQWNHCLRLHAYLLSSCQQLNISESGSKDIVSSGLGPWGSTVHLHTYSACYSVQSA